VMTLSAVLINRPDPCRIISQRLCPDHIWQCKCANRHSYNAARAYPYQNNHQTSGPQSREHSKF